jgi:hypothetical protein
MIKTDDNTARALVRDAPLFAQRVEEMGAGRHRVVLEGSFGPRWFAHLATRMAELHLSIENGFARRLNGFRWTGDVSFDASRFDGEVSRIDFVAMAMNDRSGPAQSSVQLLGYSLARSASKGCLEVSVEAEDRIGLLAGLLEHFAGLALFPYELVLRTTQGRVQDSFDLVAMGGLPPSRAVERSLDALLQRVTQPARPSVPPLSGQRPRG